MQLAGIELHKMIIINFKYVLLVIQVSIDFLILYYLLILNYLSQDFKLKNSR